MAVYDDGSDDLFGEPSKTTAEASAATQPSPNEDSNVTGEHESLVSIFHKTGDDNWLEQNHPKARAAFNLLNLALNEEAEMADALAICTVKGTSFPDKREACLEETFAIKAGESTGEMMLVPDPTNPYDQFALQVVSKYSGKQVGFIPKAAGANETYIAAMEAGRLTGAFLIEAKKTQFQGKGNAVLILATGWKKA